MKHTIILLLFSCVLWGQTEPCQKKYSSSYGNNMYRVEVYPNCSDTTICLVMTYEDNKIWRQEWFKNNQLNGISTYYSWKDGVKMVSSETLWGENFKILHSTRYFSNSGLICEASKAINDSVEFSISYYQNGNIKEFGNMKIDGYCPFGQWVEMDSLGTYKWTGDYKVVRREKIDTVIIPETGDMVVTRIMSCSEKDGVWKRIDANNRVIESLIYVEGKLED